MQKNPSKTFFSDFIKKEATKKCRKETIKNSTAADFPGIFSTYVAYDLKKIFFMAVLTRSCLTYLLEYYEIYLSLEHPL